MPPIARSTSLQKVTDRMIAEVDKVGAHKEHEVMEV